MRLISIILPCLLASGTFAADSQHVRDILKQRSDALAAENKVVLKTSDGWYFYGPELVSYSYGPFWGEHASSNGDAVNRDPLKAITECNRSLQAVGVTLVFAPIPGKSAVYIDKIDPAINWEQRWDESQQQFFELLQRQGVDVVDLLPEFLAMRKEGGEVFRKQDSHPTPAAYVRAAKVIAEHVRKQPWCASISPPADAQTLEASVENFEGDLASLYGDKDVTRDKLVMVGTWKGKELIPPDRKSPIILMGDSNVLHCHPPAGIADHLYRHLGPIDLVGVMGEGVNAPRITLARRGDNLAGKKCIIWCLMLRMTTESGEGWRLVPMVRSAAHATTAPAAR